MTRSILAWRIFDDDLVGTYHVPTGAEKGGSHCDVGVLLLNAGTAPRAGNSDLAAHLGDRLASRGIPAFRFDLPGLGDSTGSTPAEAITYWHEMLRGRNDATTLAVIDRLKQQYGLSGLIVGGLCGAAVPTLRVADNHAGAIAGLILMEPALSLDEGSMPDFRQTDGNISLSHRLRTKLRKLCSIQNWLIFLTGNNRVGTMLKSVRPLLVELQLAFVGHTLHRRMNVPLVKNWKNAVAHGTHSLVIVAEGLGRDRDVTHAMESIPAADLRQTLITTIRIPQANHIFTSGHTRDIVLDAVERWCVNECRIEIGESTI